MKTLKLLFSLAYVLLNCGCPLNSTRPSTENSDENFLEELQTSPEEINNESSHTAQINDIEGIRHLKDYKDLYKLKVDSEGISTSTYLSKSRSIQYFKPAEEGFFGSYDISYLDSCGETNVTEVVVFNNENPWYYNNTTDIFIEVNTRSPEIPILEGIRVGDPLSKLSEHLGTPDWEYDGMWIYKTSDNPGSLALFSFENNKVDWLQYGFYNSEIIDNPLKYLDILSLKRS